MKRRSCVRSASSAISSYEARHLGIKTGMSAMEAYQICPYVVMIQVHYEKYQAISKIIRRVLHDFSPDVEAYSLDEFFLDVSFMLRKDPSEIWKMAEMLKARLREATGLRASVGISYSKTYAKLCSDLQKPGGLVIVLNEDQAAQTLWDLPLKAVWGVGRRRFAKLEAEHVNTIGDAVRRGPELFQRLFGGYFGKMLFETVTGKDRAMVMPDEHHVPKEISYMHTFSDWTIDESRIDGEIAAAVQMLCYRMRGYYRRSRLFAGYIRFQDDTWKGIHFRFGTDGYTNLDEYVLPACQEVAKPLLRRFLAEGHRIRGIGLNTVEMDSTGQLELFFAEDERLSSLCYAMDRINNRFGLHSVVRGGKYHKVEGKTHFLERT